MELILAILALVVSVAAALYARQTAKEATNANNLSRLNALLALRSHYLALMDNEGKLAKLLSGTSGQRKAENEIAEVDSKLREVSREIDTYHVRLVNPQSQL